MSTTTEGAQTPEGAVEQPQRPSRSKVEILVFKTKNIDTICYRGSARAADIAEISAADVFDQQTNPAGLQRDLSTRHASDAYNYLARDPDPELPRAYPEVMLNVRDESVVEVVQVKTGAFKAMEVFRLTFDLEAIAAHREETGKPPVSRVDGNHRLFYVAGDGSRQPRDESIPFQIQLGLTPDQETNLFVDVNANQKSLNTSHLHILRSRLTPEEQELKSNPERVFARRLVESPDSPWYGLAYLGGSKAGSKAAGEDRPVSFVLLESAVRRTLVKSQYIKDITNYDAQYEAILNYWKAVREVFATEWENHKDYLILKNIGANALGVLGGTIIDRCMPRGLIKPEDMKHYVEQARPVFDWSKTAVGEQSVVGMSGNQAVLLIAGKMAEALVDPGASPVTTSIVEQLLAQAKSRGESPTTDDPALTEHPDVTDLEAAGMERSA